MYSDYKGEHFKKNNAFWNTITMAFYSYIWRIFLDFKGSNFSKEQ